MNAVVLCAIALPKERKAFSFAASTVFVTSWYTGSFGVRNVGSTVNLDTMFVSGINSALSNCSYMKRVSLE